VGSPSTPTPPPQALKDGPSARFIEIATLRAHPAGVARNPNGSWVDQQARNPATDDVLEQLSMLIRDHDSKFTDAFDTGVASQGIRTILTPVRTPVANSYAERFVRTIRRDCLDCILIRNERPCSAVPIAATSRHPMKKHGTRGLS
jgi:putative transposase